MPTSLRGTCKALKLLAFTTMCSLVVGIAMKTKESFTPKEMLKGLGCSSECLLGLVKVLGSVLSTAKTAKARERWAEASQSLGCLLSVHCSNCLWCTLSHWTYTITPRGNAMVFISSWGKQRVRETEMGEFPKILCWEEVGLILVCLN